MRLGREEKESERTRDRVCRVGEDGIEMDVGEGGGDAIVEEEGDGGGGEGGGEPSSSVGKAILISRADLSVYCIGPKLPIPLPTAGGDGGGDGREEAARARLED